MTVQAASCFFHFSQFLKVVLLHFLLTQVILFPSQVSDEVENFIVTLLLDTRFRAFVLVKRDVSDLLTLHGKS